ncbi:MAG: hypothetical protein HZC24_03605 [Rhodocyclales bacterium]|nr:hypothetical protein [Rhodocyclales bacterium]
MDKPVYFISDRPEAYEVWGEVSHEEAKAIARTIAEHAARHFSDVEFRIDSAWHNHGPGMGKVADYIDSNWEAWAAAVLVRT